MLDLRRLVGFDWDEGNIRKNAAKHAVSQLECEQTFFNEPLLLLPDIKHSEAEDRWHALGRSDQGRLLHITFTVRGEATLIRIISARDMSRRERGYYAKGH
ncbi:MAG: BrnT family toxin [Bosea sp. (in: a-proteobacteria)]